MNPTRVKARNYRTFRDLDVTLPAGAVAILGQNGAGKSSLANLVDLSLFGPDGRSWAPYLTQGAESTELEIELTFDHAGDTYRIRRGYSARGSGKTTLDLEIQSRHKVEPVYVWDPLTREDQRQTQALIETLLGMTRETFRASSMLVQGDGAAFTEAKPADRKRVLAKILGLDRYDDLQKIVKADRRGFEDRLQKIAGGLEQADRELVTEDGDDRIALGEGILAGVMEAIAIADAAAEPARQELGALEEAIAAANRLAQQKAETFAEWTAAAGRLVPLRQRANDADAALPTLQVVVDELESLATTDQIVDLQTRRAEIAGEVEVYRQAVVQREQAEREAALATAQRGTVTARIAGLREKVAEIAASIAHVASGTVDSCPTCRQALGVEAREATVSSLRARATTIEDEIATLTEGLELLLVQPEIPELPPRPEEAEQAIRALDERLAKANQDGIQRARLEERAAQIRRTIDAKPTEQELREAARAEREARDRHDAIDAPTFDAVAVLQQNLAAARARLAEIASRRAEADVQRAKVETGLERLRELRDRTDLARQERLAVQYQIDELAILEKAYGRDGIPALIIGRAAIPAIETEANRILGELATSYRVELRTEKALAAGGTADALDVVIVTEDGERPYETFSGGERTRINLAVRIGLARLLAHRRGAESRILVIDEPEYLDQAGTAALATVLRGLADVDFDRVYLISHVPELRDSLDATIEVVRGDDGYSQIGGSA